MLVPGTVCVNDLCLGRLRNIIFFKWVVLLRDVVSLC